MTVATLVAALGLLGGAVVAQGEGPAFTQRARPVDTAYSCVVCHADKRRVFLLGVHSERGIRCHDCHGGNPRSFETPTAHRGRFLGSPTKVETVRLCASCHADPDQMRQYGIPADQLAELRTSRHGQLLLREGNTDAPTCTDCHDAHTILPPNDARSNVYPTNIPETCAHCHTDAALMGRYGLPTDQYRRYRESAHGVALFERQNFAAPTCIGCHGSHAALPAGVTEVANVCGRCHVLVRQAFYRGPHGAPALTGKLPGCTGCHSNHGTEGVPPSAIAETCTRCHESEGEAVLMGLELQQLVERATEDLQAAERGIEQLLRAGHDVTDARFRYRTALTSYRQIAEVQHSLDVTRLEELSRQVRSVSQDIGARAEGAAEHRWEHKLLLVPVWFLALAAVVLAWFKLQELGQRS